jgi:preprotein translocase subunit YajC
MHPFLHAFLSQQADGGGGLFGGATGFLPILLMIGVIYFVMLRPQAKERKKVDAFRKNLKKGDKVWTQGGIIGTVAQVEDQAVVVDIGAGKVRFLKTFIGGEWKEKTEAPEPAKVEAKK